MALVFEFMDHKDLGAYLEKTEGPGNERELVRLHLYIHRSPYQRLESSCWK